MSSADTLAQQLQEGLGDQLAACGVSHGMATIEVARANLLAVCTRLRDEFGFEQLTDCCGVDYSAYGQVDWTTETATSTGFSRGRDSNEPNAAEWNKPRYAVAYHLISYKHNLRLRVRCFAENDDYPMVDSVTGIWSGADWFEREAFDMFGILFEGHPDLRRILTDYGFIGHPFRKDFPLIGHVEMRYDVEKKRVVYQPVTIKPRVNTPRTIRHDSRHGEAQTVQDEQQEQAG